MDGYLSKPVRADELLDTVERHAERGRNPDAGTEAPDPATPDGEGLDVEVALAHVNGDRRLLREIATLFLVDSSRTLATLRRAIRGGDAAVTRAAAHALKGSVAIFGARQATELARELQRMGDTSDLAAAPSVLLALESHVAALHHDLAAFVGTKPRARRPRARAAGTRPSSTRQTAKRKR
jgi:HPt (histidine-containing phosphotransfer) domain-containing protein